MSLKGSLETVALSEVLHLLADTSKSGELHVEGSRTDGRLWFESGELSGFEVGRSDEAADALFELLRIDTGDFHFDADASRPDSAHVSDSGREDIRPVLDVAQARLEEWREIVAVIPSLDHHVQLAEHPANGEVRLDPDQWSLVVAVGEGRPVGDVLEKRNLREYFGCKALKALVDESLVEVSEPVAVLAEESVQAEESVVVDEPVFDEPVAEAHAVESAPVEEASASVDDDAVVLSHIPVLASWDATPEAHEVHSNGNAAGAGAEDGDAPVSYEEAEMRSSARAEIEALLAEMAPKDEVVAEGDEPPVDGLEDRGPWTTSELASLDQVDGWREEQDGIEPDMAAVFHPGSGYDADVEGAAEYDEAAEGHGEQSAEYAGFYEGAQVEASADDQAVAEVEPEAEPEAEQPVEEPINRGLLLKFLSSVRN